MREKKTFTSSCGKESTSGTNIATETYISGDSYRSRTNTGNTASSPATHHYMSSDRSTSLSTKISRTQEKISMINNILKKINR